MRSVIITSNAGAAWDELSRWADTLARQAIEAEAIREDYPNARVVFALDDPCLPGQCYPDHHARICAHAAAIYQEHARLTETAPTREIAEKHLSAAAAWRAVLTERDRKELEARLRIAIEASAAIVERCRSIDTTNAPPSRSDAHRISGS